tara:strand:+ start:415 stop:1053 length:639 start_codon:yes stop_codon:yes gene_type:complete
MKKEDLPNIVPVFPLSNAIFFPKTILPLNIFEDRYLQLVDDCMKKNRMFGMVQPKNDTEKPPKVYSVGCLGKIISFSETTDKRFIITLLGLARFKIKKELKKEKLYRIFEVDYSEFLNDLENKKEEFFNPDKENLLKKIQIFFKKINYPIKYNELSKLDMDELINNVSMISPFSIEEKQKLIETKETNNKMKVLNEIINFNLLDFEETKTIQ